MEAVPGILHRGCEKRRRHDVARRAPSLRTEWVGWPRSAFLHWTSRDHKWELSGTSCDSAAGVIQRNSTLIARLRSSGENRESALLRRRQDHGRLQSRAVVGERQRTPVQSTYGGDDGKPQSDARRAAARVPPPEGLGHLEL